MQSNGTANWLYLVMPATVMLGISGCLGPNPGFFVSTSAANSAISTLVNAFLTNALGLGGS